MTLNCWNWLKWKCANYCPNTNSQATTCQLSKVPQNWRSKATKVHWAKKQSRNWLMHSTATSQHQNAQLTVHSCCQLKTCSPSLVAVQLLQVVSNAVSLKSAKRSKSLVLKTQ